jgi:hypothetical protein
LTAAVDIDVRREGVRGVLQLSDEAGQAASAVSVELQGGLGNQMFQYAAGYAVARRTHARLKLNLDYFTQQNKRQFLLDCYGITAEAPTTGASVRVITGRARVFADRVRSKLRLSAPPANSDVAPVYRQQGYHYDPSFRSLQPPLQLFGYFQSELFFADFAEEIREAFTIRVPVSSGFREIESKIQSAAFAVSLHVRRGDYVSEKHTFDFHGICDLPYYKRTMELANRMGGARPAYFVFTDDPEAARELLSSEPDVTFVQGDAEKPWEDLALMSYCRGHILANSSFSWWGAWLDPKPDKWVLAPREWFARSQLRTISTADLYCDGWITL